MKAAVALKAQGLKVQMMNKKSPNKKKEIILIINLSKIELKRIKVHRKLMKKNQTWLLQDIKSISNNQTKQETSSLLKYRKAKIW